MNNLNYNINDYHNGFQNNQRILIGDGSDLDEKFIYFITSIIGTSVTITNSALTALFVASNYDFSHPVRIDGGFSVTGTNNTVIYYAMPKGIN